MSAIQQALTQFWRTLRAAGPQWPPEWQTMAVRQHYMRLMRRYGAAAVARRLSGPRLRRAVRARVRKGLL